MDLSTIGSVVGHIESVDPGDAVEVGEEEGVGGATHRESRQVRNGLAGSRGHAYSHCGHPDARLLAGHVQLAIENIDVTNVLAVGTEFKRAAAPQRRVADTAVSTTGPQIDAVRTHRATRVVAVGKIGQCRGGVDAPIEANAANRAWHVGGSRTGERAAGGDGGRIAGQQEIPAIRRPRQESFRDGSPAGDEGLVRAAGDRR